MIPVDLNRLREARDHSVRMAEDSQAWAIELLEKTAEAVLGAPTVWWCFTNMRESEPGHGIDHTQVVCDLCDDWEGCGWVALVPVKGES